MWNISGKGKRTKYYVFYELFTFNICIILREKHPFVGFLGKQGFYIIFSLFLSKKGFDHRKRGFYGK